jgi:hypothetical protein
LGQIGTQIVVVLNTDGKPQQGISDAQSFALVTRHFHMRSLSGRTNGGFHAAKAHCGADQLQTALEVSGTAPCRNSNDSIAPNPRIWACAMA